jgi:hypothetical protein
MVDMWKDVEKLQLIQAVLEAAFLSIRVKQSAPEL